MTSRDREPMALIDDINSLPTSIVENTTNHLNHHQVIHTALQDNITRLENVEHESAGANFLVNSVANKVDAYEPRVVALEALNGLSPESPVDGQTASLVSNPDTLTRQALRKDFSPRLSVAASPAMGARVIPAVTTPRIVGRIGDDLVAYVGGRIYLSPDETAWRDVAPTPQGAAVQIILPCEDGEVLCAIYQSLWRSVGWGTGTVTWQQKHVSNGGSYLEPYSVNGRAGKFIVADYGGRLNSRYAKISIDDGKTWTQVWDSDINASGVAPDFSHIHGVEYDHYRDRFYLSEGHGSVAGLYVSVDDGATWMKPPGLYMDPAPTTVNVTPDGLVCGSDSERAGLLGVVAQDNPMDEKFTEIWRWRTGQDGVLGFGVSGHTDPDTGIVYVAFRNGQAGIAPIIAGGTPTAGGLVWQYSGTDAALVDDVRHAVVKNGRLYAHGTIAGQDRQIRGHVPPPGVPMLDTTMVRVEGTSAMVGYGATTDGLRATAVGNGARAMGTQDTTAVGHDALSEGGDSLAVGKSARAGASAVAIGNRATTTEGGRETAVGRDAKTTGGDATAVGGSATASILSTAIGVDATTSAYSTAIGTYTAAGPSGLAVGHEATAAEESVAVGRGTTSGFASIAIGNHASAVPQSLAVGAQTTALGSKSTAVGQQSVADLNGTSLGYGANADGFSVAIGQGAISGPSSVALGMGAKTASGGRELAIGRSATTTAGDAVAIGGDTQAAVYGVAIGTDAQAASLATAIGRNAKALHNNAVAIGQDTVATVGDQVALGARHLELGSIATPTTTPADGKYRIYADVVEGKMRLMVRFPTGAPVLIAQEV